MATATKKAATKSTAKTAANADAKPIDTKSAEPAASNAPAQSATPTSDKPSEPTTKASKKSGEMIRVRSKVDRFRRAGIEFIRDGIELDVSQLTAEQVDAIANEPNLIIDDGELPASAKKSAR